MRTEIVRIGNSRGIRIPKPLIEQCGFGDQVELRVQEGCLVISVGRRIRDGWEAAFLAAGSSLLDERLLESATENEFDRREWRW
jgi:antitoxin MazE